MTVNGSDCLSMAVAVRGCLQKAMVVAVYTFSEKDLVKSSRPLRYVLEMGWSFILHNLQEWKIMREVIT